MWKADVGGAVTDAVFDHLNVGARISFCGSISQYNQDEPEPEPGPRNMGMLVRLQARAEGFLVGQFRNCDEVPRQAAGQSLRRVIYALLLLDREDILSLIWFRNLRLYPR